MAAIGSPLLKRRLVVVAAWIALAVALGIWVPSPNPRANQPASFLPADAPYSRAIAAMRESFPADSGLSEAVVVFARRHGRLSAADRTAIEDIARRIGQPLAGTDSQDLAGVLVRSPGQFLLKPNPLISTIPDKADKASQPGRVEQVGRVGQVGQAGLVIVSIPANFITIRSDRVVKHIYDVLHRAKLPAGLEVSVTGSSGFGHDYADAAKSSQASTLYVTLAAVIIILLVVYRSPIAAMVPLAAISLAAFVALKLLACAQQFGMHVGTAERIFVMVLLYGAGTDYSLFFISRFREFLADGLAAPAAAATALDSTFPATLASGGTDTAGLLMLCLANYGVFRTTGPAVAVALVVATLAALTLVPSLVAIIGTRLFWPARPAADAAFADGRDGLNPGLGLGGRRFWPGVARVVTARPTLVLVVVLVGLAGPAVRGLTLNWVYDTLADLKPSTHAGVGNAAAGIDAVKRRWSVGQIAPVGVLIRTDRQQDERQWRQVAGRLTRLFAASPGVRAVRSLTRPLGRAESALGQAVLEKLAAARIKRQYLSADMRAMRLAVILDSPAYSLAAMDTVARLRNAARGEAERIERPGKTGTELYFVGATAEMMNIRTITQADFVRVAAATLLVIFVMVFLLLRDAWLSAFMVASTVISYFAALGLSYWAFAGLAGDQGLDWKVQVFLFVVMVAVGVDYNIFLASRMAQEARKAPAALAVRIAVTRTGPVISSCGLIMAATLGSLMAGDLKLLKQLGFALAMGMLIDTFVVRPLLLPAFACLSGRTGRAVGLGH